MLPGVAYPVHPLPPPFAACRWSPQQKLRPKMVAKKYMRKFYAVFNTVIVLDGNSEIGAHVGSNLTYSIG